MHLILPAIVQIILNNIQTCYYESIYFIEVFLHELEPSSSLHFVILILVINPVFIFLLLLIVSIVYEESRNCRKCSILF